MKTISFTEANRNLESVINHASSDTVVIKRNNDKDVVLMSLGHYHQLMDSIEQYRIPGIRKPRHTPNQIWS